MENKLVDKKVAILVTDGFEQSEFLQPLEELKKQGAIVDIISIKKGTIRSWNNNNWGDEFEATVAITDAQSADYDALVLPGGVFNPDKLRMNKEVVAFVRDFMEDEKPVAAICHGPWLLIETGLLKGRKLTSYRSVRTDLINAGAQWVDEQVVVDDGLVTSRSPKDLDAFCAKMIEEISEGVHH
jgi:protease I